MRTPIRYAACFVLSVLATSAAVFSSQDPPKPGESGVEKPTEKPSSSWVLDRQHTRVRFEADGSGTREVTMHIRVNDDLGVRQAGQIPLNYAPSSEELAISTLEVRKRDGRVVSVSPDAVQDHAVQPYASATMFLDVRQKLITVPSLQPGDTIVLAALWKITRPIIANHAWYEHTFVKHALTDDERLVIDLPASLTAVVRVDPRAPREHNGGSGEISGDRRVYRWTTSNLSLPKEDDEEDEDPDEAPPPDVRVTTFRDWEAVAAWFRPLMHPPADAALRAKVAELTKGLRDQNARIQAIYDYVATQIRYVSLSFGLGRFAPHAPGGVLKNQYGDCKDKHALLAAMLDVIGVKAVAVLINTERSISDDLPSPAEFDHVITAIASGPNSKTWTWLDTTTEVAPVGMLASPLRDKQALFIGTGDLSPHLVRTPIDGPFAFVSAVDVDGQINALGVLTATVRYRFRGDSELVMRGAIRALPREQIADFAKGFAAAVGFKGDVANFKTSDPVATREPFEVTFTLRRGGYLDWAAASATLQPVTGVTDGVLEELKTDRNVGAFEEHRRRFTVALPPGYAAIAPVGVTVAQRGLEFRSAYHVEANRLVAERTFARKTHRLEARHAADYVALGRTITSDQEQSFSVTRTGAGRPAIPADMTAGELYSAGYSAFNANDYEAAVAIWKRAAEVDPKHASTWSGLGFAYQRLKRYDEAIVAMEKQVALDPGNKRVYTDLGYVAKEAGKLDVAARAYAKHVELNPLDGAATKTLGEIYDELGDYDKAIEAFEKAAPLLKEDAWVYLQLGSARLDAKHLAQGKAAIERAVAMNSSPAVLTKAGWEFALHGETGRAIELLDRATKAVRDGMANVAAARLTPEQFDLMDRLAWIWDARGLLALRKKDTALAISYFDAAWRLAGHELMAEHLGEAYEQAENRKADALNAYLVARSVSRNPSRSLVERIERLAGKADFDAAMKAAQMEFMKERGAILSVDLAEGSAKFNALLGPQGTPTDVVMVNGDETLLPLATKLMESRFPLTLPDTFAVPLAVKLDAQCSRERKRCMVLITPSRAVTK